MASAWCHSQLQQQLLNDFLIKLVPDLSRQNHCKPTLQGNKRGRWALTGPAKNQPASPGWNCCHSQCLGSGDGRGRAAGRCLCRVEPNGRSQGCAACSACSMFSTPAPVSAGVFLRTPQVSNVNGTNPAIHTTLLLIPDTLPSYICTRDR